MNEFEFNRKVYNDVAEAYHNKRQNPKSGAWNDFLEVPAIESLLKPLVKNKRVLDLGCGTGLLTQKLVDWGANACGVDQSEKMIEIAKLNLPKLKFDVGTATNLPYKNSELPISLQLVCSIKSPSSSSHRSLHLSTDARHSAVLSRLAPAKLAP